MRTTIFAYFTEYSVVDRWQANFVVLSWFLMPRDFLMLFILQQFGALIILTFSEPGTRHDRPTIFSWIFMHRFSGTLDAVPIYRQ